LYAPRTLQATSVDMETVTGKISIKGASREQLKQMREFNYAP
jgi:hypothetical protein